MARKFFRKFEKSELKYLLFSSIIVFFLILIINVVPISSWISSFNPIIQFLLLNIGLYFTFFFFIKGLSLNGRWTWQFPLVSIIMFLAFDLILPEYHVTVSQGLVVGGVFGASAIDYFFGYIYSLIGATGWLLVFLTYLFTFVVLLFIEALLLKNFVENIE